MSIALRSQISKKGLSGGSPAERFLEGGSWQTRTSMRGLPTACSLSSQLRDHGEQWHVERNHDTSDGDAEDADDGGLEHGQHVFGSRVDFFFVEVGNLLQHAVHGACSF